MVYSMVVVISILRMLREPPEEQTLTVMMQVIKDTVAHTSSKPEDVGTVPQPSSNLLPLSLHPWHASTLPVPHTMHV